MQRLTRIEEECEAVLASLIDLMGAGHSRMTHATHLELLSRVRDCHRRLINKSYGCMTGSHAGACHCKGELPHE